MMKKKGKRNRNKKGKKEIMEPSREINERKND